MTLQDVKKEFVSIPQYDEEYGLGQCFGAVSFKKRYSNIIEHNKSSQEESLSTFAALREFTARKMNQFSKGDLNLLLLADTFQNKQNNSMHNSRSYLNYDARPTSYQQRPSTPLAGHSRPQYPPNFNPNRSYSKLPNVSSNPNAPRNQFGRSRISLGASSCATQLGQMMQEHTDVFPQDLVFLISNEQKNINIMKEKIEREKSKVENDFAIFRTEIDHVLEDIKLSVQAELDLVYRTYITKYAQLKGQVQQLRLLRKQVLMMNQGNWGNNGGKGSMVSNKDLITEIERDAEHFRNFKIYGYLSELQKQKLQPLLELANDLVVVGACQVPFYRNKELCVKLGEVKTHFKSFIKDVFESLAEYVISPESLLDKHKQQMQNTRTVLKDLDAGQSRMKPFDVHYPVNQRENVPPKKANKVSGVSSGGQGLVTKWCDDIKLNRLQRVQTDHNDSILCIFFVADKYIATGSKDATINVYTLDGRKIRTLRGHEAAICCLSTVQSSNGETLLASGSDHGCSSLILWDTRSWSILSRIQAHSAAVTGIVDLQDGKHVATGSYDKKINIYNLARNQVTMTLNNNRTSVTGMVMASSGSKLVSSGLDKSMTVWSVLRNASGVVEQVTSEKVIPGEELICQLQPSLLRPELIFCAGRDGTLKLINIASGRVEKTYTVNANSLIELVAVQRQMNADAPLLLTCSAKDSALVVTKMQSGLSNLLKLSGGLGIDYGCGIGPKVVLSQANGGCMAVVSQKPNARQFSLYQLDLK